MVPARSLNKHATDVRATLRWRRIWVHVGRHAAVVKGDRVDGDLAAARIVLLDTCAQLTDTTEICEAILRQW